MMLRVRYFIRTLIAIAVLLVCPVLQVRATDPLPWAGVIGSADPHFVREGDSVDESVLEEHQLVQRFNKLVVALRGFSDTYNSGHVIDVKRVKAVKKAWRELEKSDWFKPGKTD